MRPVLFSVVIITAAFTATIGAAVNGLDVRDSITHSGSDPWDIWVPNVYGNSQNNAIKFSGPSLDELGAASQNQENFPSVITRFGIRGSIRVDQINYDVTFSNNTQGSYAFGGHGGDQISIDFLEGEFISRLEVRCESDPALNQNIQWMRITTNFGQTISRGNYDSNVTIWKLADVKERMVGFTGTYGDELVQIGPIMARNNQISVI